MSVSYKITFLLDGSERTQRRPGPTAERAVQRIKDEYAKKPHWGVPIIRSVERISVEGANTDAFAEGLSKTLGLK